MEGKNKTESSATVTGVLTKAKYGQMPERV